jgi:dsRNA-specific ribonuclease
MSNIEHAIGYIFNNRRHLDLAFKIEGEVNERREFRILAGYGDAILRFAAWEYLVKQEEVFKIDKSIFREEFGRKINSFVGNDNLEKISNKLGLSSPAECIEALIGAVYIDRDNNFENAKQVAKTLLQKVL